MTSLNLIIVVCPFQIFCEVAYLASSRGDILDGIEKFIDDLTVLPPSIWDLNVRLDPPRTTVSLVCDELFLSNKIMNQGCRRISDIVMKLLQYSICQNY